jgi:hypothetical protein
MNLFNLTYENSIFPFHLFGIQFLSYDEINTTLNYLWIIQIAICFLYCLKQKKYIPSSSFKQSIYIKQIYAYFLTSSFVYLIEMLLSNILITLFERFMHHLFATVILCSVIFEPQILSVIFIMPSLIHSIYWLRTNGDYSEILLFSYNFDILINLAIMVLTTYNKKLKLYVHM